MLLRSLLFSRLGCITYVLVCNRLHPLQVEASANPLDIQVLMRSNLTQGTLIDDSVSEPAHWAPWTHKPYCIPSTTGRKTKYCVFSNAHHGENGIAFITTPEAAAESTEVLEDDPTDVFLTPKQVARWSKHRPYEVQDVPAKGKGLIATRFIAKYDAFLIDQATLVADMEMAKSISHIKGRLLLHQAASQLGHPAIVTSLSKRGDREDSDEVEDVMLTNAFDTELAGKPHMALFPKVARINHACNPNAFVMFSPSGLSVGIKAYRDIRPGEEITISYAPMGGPSADRHAVLSRWGFTCKCSLCTAPSSQIAASDARRNRVEAIRQEVPHYISGGEYGTAIEHIHEALELLEEEELRMLEPEHYQALARIHLVMGEREKAEKYGELALGILKDHGFLGREDEAEQWDLDMLLKSQETARGEDMN